MSFCRESDHPADELRLRFATDGPFVTARNDMLVFACHVQLLIPDLISEIVNRFLYALS